MDKPWYRRLTPHHPESDSLPTQTKKAEDGDAEAQFGLGLKFANGEGDVQDYPQAAQWYRKAADQNHALAQFNLGMMYALGQGMVANEGEAVRWIRRAAEQGDAAAQFNLGNRYHRASVSGLEMDAAESRIEAYKWFQLAAAQGYKDSLLTCEPITLRMTHDDVVEGNGRVAAFVAVNREKR
jgi:TPR repeat protein